MYQQKKRKKQKKGKVFINYKHGGAVMTHTIVMVHGMFSGGWYWNRFKHFFEEKQYQCFTPTLRHHDVDPQKKPDTDLGTTSLKDYAEDIENLILNLDEKPILFGHSMGGLIAQILGQQGLSKGLVLLTPAPPRGITSFKYSALKSFLAGCNQWEFWRKPLRLSPKSAIYAMLDLLPESEQKMTYERLVYDSGKAGSEIGFWLFDSKKTSKVDESKVTCPVLIISGSEDRAAPPSMVRKIANKYKAVSTYKAFDNHAHWIANEPGWRDVAEYVNGWIKQNIVKNVAR